MKRNTWQREAVREALDGTEGFISAQSLHSALQTVAQMTTTPPAAG